MAEKTPLGKRDIHYQTAGFFFAKKRGTALSTIPRGEKRSFEETCVRAGKGAGNKEDKRGGIIDGREKKNVVTSSLGKGLLTSFRKRACNSP